MTIPELKAEYREREAQLYRLALEQHGWNAGRAAAALDVHANSVRKAISRHGWRDEYDARNPGRGRPSASGQ